MNIRNKPIKLGANAYNALLPYIPDIGIFTDKSSDIYREAIKKIPKLAYEYAKDMIQERWPEAEPYIMKSEFAAYYAKYIIKGRWPEAEPYIMRDPVAAFYYARDVITGRWPEAEPIILANPFWASEYAKMLRRK